MVSRAELIQAYPKWISQTGVKDALFSGGKRARLLESYSGVTDLPSKLRQQIDPSGQVIVWAETRTGAAHLVEAFIVALTSTGPSLASNSAKAALGNRISKINAR